MKLYSNYNRFKSTIQMKMCHVIASIGIKMPKMIYLQPQIRKSWDSMENANKKRK